MPIDTIINNFTSMKPMYCSNEAEHKFRLVILAWLFIAILVHNSVHAAPEMEIVIDRNTVYEGESLNYQIVVTDTEPIGDAMTPNLAGFDAFEIQAFPKQAIAPASSSVKVVINNKVVRDESTRGTAGFVFPYKLTPKKAGEFRLPVPQMMPNSGQTSGQTSTPIQSQLKSVKIGNRTFSPNDADGVIPIIVRAPDSQDIAFLSISSSTSTDRVRVYPHQFFTVSLIVQLKGLPGDLKNKNPLSVLPEPPHLQIPWVDEATQLPKGLLPKQELNAWLSALNVRGNQRGFALNNYVTGGIGFDDDFFSSPFSSGLFRRSVLMFSPNPRQIQRPDASGTDVTYWEYRFTRTFRATEVGTYSFGPVSLKGNLAVADSSSRDGASLQNIYTVAPALSVQVVDVPETNRPDCYIGAFGTFDWSAQIVPQKAKVGEPLTLTLRLNGEGATTYVKPPNLEKMTAITDNFKIYPPSEDVGDKSCVFTYTIRPTKEGTILFPAIPVAVFNVDKEEFQTLESKPITLTISSAEQLRTSQTWGPTFGQSRLISPELQLSNLGFFANMSEPAGAINQRVSMRLWLTTLIVFVSIYLTLACTLFFVRKWRSDPKWQRNRGAGSRALRKLTKIEKQLSQKMSSSDKTQLSNSQLTLSELTEVCNNLQNVIFGFIADITDSQENGMTTKDTCKKMKEIGYADELIKSTENLLESLDGAKYGGLDLHSIDERVAKTKHILSSLQQRNFSKK
ncbi:MAG: BatD family protein [Thermoguttaceae bacterium]